MGLQEKSVFAVPSKGSVWSQEDCIWELYMGALGGERKKKKMNKVSRNKIPWGLFRQAKGV